MHGSVHGVVHGALGVLPGLVRLDLGIGGGLDGGGEEVVGVVSCTTHAPTHARPSLPVVPYPNPARTQPNRNRTT